MHVYAYTSTRLYNVDVCKHRLAHTYVRTSMFTSIHKCSWVDFGKESIIVFSEGEGTTVHRHTREGSGKQHHMQIRMPIYIYVDMYARSRNPLVLMNSCICVCIYIVYYEFIYIHILIATCNAKADIRTLGTSRRGGSARHTRSFGSHCNKRTRCVDNCILCTCTLCPYILIHIQLQISSKTQKVARR